jgi:hypothetical protein
MIIRFAMLALACLLSGCAATNTNPPVQYVRVDGAPTNVAYRQAAEAQCREVGSIAGQRAITSTAGDGLLWRLQAVAETAPANQATAYEACMARLGYVAQR